MKRLMVLLLFVFLLSGCGYLEKYRVKRGEAWITEGGVEGAAIRYK